MRSVVSKARPRSAAPSANTKEILAHLNSAFRDYLGARVLLNSGLPVQGAVLASTAIEKYLKALLAFRGNRSPGHLKTAHINALRNFDAGLFSAVNLSFLALLRKCYSLRYPDALRPPFNLVIATREFLAELDHTALAVQDAFHLFQGGKPVETQYHSLARSKDSRLIADNHRLGGIAKDVFVAAAPQLVYELRILPPGVEIEIYYMACAASSDGQFLRQALVPDPTDPRNFGLALKAATA